MIERARAAISALTGKAAVTQSSYGTGPYARSRVQIAVQGTDPRGGARLLRHFSRRNDWVRLAITVRKRQVAQAKWKLVRNDDPKKPPDPRVLAKVRDLLRTVNPKRESLRSLLDQVIEDVLVLDAGCIEKEKTIGGDIVALWGVDGATIVPDPNWDGSQQDSPRYYQIIDGRKVAELRNDQLIYIMGSPSTYSPIGWSCVESLVRAIEADLYGEQYDYDMLRQAAPSGLLDLGRGLTPQELEAAREYYESEIAGSKELMIVGFMGDPAANPGSGSVTYTPFARSNREQQRDFYKTWLVRKIACVFELDPTVFGITGDVNRATSRTLSSRTDEGHVALANLVAEYLTRELIWEIDERHDFEFDGVVARDEERQAKIDQAYMAIGATTPNEIRAREGLDPFPGSMTPAGVPIAGHWANLPYPFNQDTGTPQTQPDPEEPAEPDTPPDAPDEPDEPDQEGAKSAVPFVAARPPTGSGNERSRSSSARLAKRSADA